MQKLFLRLIFYSTFAHAVGNSAKLAIVHTDISILILIDVDEQFKSVASISTIRAVTLY